MLWLAAFALAVEVMVYTPDGPAQAGARAVIEVALADGPRPVSGATVGVTVAKGQVLGPAVEVAPGRYRVEWLAPAVASDESVGVRVGDAAPVTRTLAVRGVAEGGVRDAQTVDAAVGTSRLEVRFPIVGPVEDGALIARVSEGRVVDLRVESEAVVVAVEGGPERYARVMAVTLLDGRLPGRRPAFGLVHLRARPQITLTADPGSTATIRVSRRTYGPFTADASGQVSATFDVVPGESSYEILVSDDLGNTQSSTGPLPTSPRPVLVGTEAPAAGGGAVVWLGAWGPTGSAWTGAAPVCRTGTGTKQEAAWVARGLYVFAVRTPEGEGALFDPRVDCALGDSAASMRVAVGAEQPDRVELRVYPAALDADFPIAEVQAALLDRRGERLPVEGLRVEARDGELALESWGASMRGEYRGAAAVPRGGDTLVASWDHPAGAGAPWSVDLHGAVDGATIVLMARARDRMGRPLAGVPVRFAVESGAPIEIESDARGWARGRMTWDVQTGVVRAMAGDVGRATVVFRDAPALLPDPERADIEARVELPIRAGRVRQIQIAAEPSPLLTGTGQEAVVTVRVLDSSGNPIRDEPVRIEADVGRVSPGTARADGAVEARYTPPPGPVSRTVHLTARASTSSATTELELVPRPVRGSVAVGAGWITDFSGPGAPTLYVAHANRLPVLPEVLQSRLVVGAWSGRFEIKDEDTGDVLAEVQATFVPIELGVQGVSRAGLRSIQAGIAAVVAPYQLSVDFGDSQGLNGADVATPGLALSAGAGWRVGGSELFAEVRYLLFTAGGEQVAFAGSVGGLTATAGYRVLY